MPENTVPRPLAEAARAEVQKVLTGETTATGVVTALVGWGLLSVAQGDAVAGLLGLLPGVVAMVGAVIAKARGAMATFREAEPKVTPIDAPAVVVGGARTPLVVPGGTPVLPAEASAARDDFPTEFDVR